MVIHGWTIYFHRCFEEQLNELLKSVLGAVQRRPNDYKKSNSFKRLAAIAALAFDQIPSDPTNPKYRQGDSLGETNTHWFRAKFFQQYRIFFRFNEQERVIVFAWVNDDNTLRAYGSKKDAYVTFRKMLAAGHPPTDWKALKAGIIEEEQLNDLAAQVRALQEQQ